MFFFYEKNLIARIKINRNSKQVQLEENRKIIKGSYYLYLIYIKLEIRKMNI